MHSGKTISTLIFAAFIGVIASFLTAAFFSITLTAYGLVSVFWGELPAKLAVDKTGSVGMLATMPFLLAVLASPAGLIGGPIALFLIGTHDAGKRSYYAKYFLGGTCVGFVAPIISVLLFPKSFLLFSHLETFAVLPTLALSILGAIWGAITGVAFAWLIGREPFFDEAKA